MGGLGVVDFGGGIDFDDLVVGFGLWLFGCCIVG